MQRWVDIKLYFNEDTPDDYEPPMFRPADDDAPLRFSTHGINEHPEVFKIGHLQTGHHG
jgi:meiosis-specific protein HOP1